jgi:hypothetical protein
MPFGQDSLDGSVLRFGIVDGSVGCLTRSLWSAQKLAHKSVFLHKFMHMRMRTRTFRD